MRWPLLFLLAAACAPDELDPFAETVLVVDTDLPVPQVATRLRVDLHAGDRWLESRDIALPDPRDWPPSFSVWSEDTEHAAEVLVRLRVYPEGRVRDYLGERLDDGTPPADGAPRLLRDGVDLTPPTEPDPATAVDRLLIVRMEPGVLARRHVALRALCAGAKVDLGGALSCVDVEKTRAPAVVVTAADGGERGEPPTPIAGGCDGGGDDARACIPGGATILGSGELTLYPALPAVPERLVVEHAFLVDREEVSVARFRAALAAGFTPAVMPTANDGPLGVEIADTCTWSTTDLGREAYAVSCLPWQTARDLCIFSGGDLPSEAQWERMARLASERGRSRYPWGDDPPSCDRAVYGRFTLGGIAGVCEPLGAGPFPLAASAADLTAEGVVGVAGGLAEWTLDAYESYASPCWQASPVTDPRCFYDGAATRSIRGGSWASPPAILQSAVRLGVAAAGAPSFVGVRCAYPLP